MTGLIGMPKLAALDVVARAQINIILVIRAPPYDVCDPLDN